MKSSTLARLIMFGIGFPLVMVVVFFLPQEYCLAFTAFVLAFSVIGSLELDYLFKLKGGLGMNRALVVLIGAALPASFYLLARGLIAPEAIGAVVFSLAAVAFVPEVFRRNAADFGDSLLRYAARALVILYPGLFLSFAILIANGGSPAYLASYLCMVFGNDSLAYVFGMVFGRKRGILAVSPAKSLAGFLGGFLSSIGLAFVAQAISPESFPGPAWKPLVLGAALGVATILGDLIESAMKRSAGVKDSGTIMPGRGGILDSIDSIIFTAPLFYYLANALF